MTFRAKFTKCLGEGENNPIPTTAELRSGATGTGPVPQGGRIRPAIVQNACAERKE